MPAAITAGLVEPQAPEPPIWIDVIRIERIITTENFTTKGEGEGGVQ
jgi:hypothetical protein